MELTQEEFKALNREKSYRRAKLGCLILAAISFLAFAAMLASGAANAPGSDTGTLSAVPWVWLALAYAAHVHIKRCATIRRLRQLIATSAEKEQVTTK